MVMQSMILANERQTRDMLEDALERSRQSIVRKAVKELVVHHIERALQTGMERQKKKKQEQSCITTHCYSWLRATFGACKTD